MRSSKSVFLMSRVIVVSLVVVPLMLSCADDKKCDTNGDEDLCPAPATPDDLIDALACYYEARDADGYESLLCDDYLFDFTPDVADSLGLPHDEPWWGKQSDVMSTRSMFNDTTVAHITMSLSKVDEWLACLDTRPDTTFNGLCCRFEPDIRVTLERGGYDLLTLWANASWLDVVIIPDPLEENTWCVLRITEREKGTLSDTEKITWGGIKSLWKEQPG